MSHAEVISFIMAMVLMPVMGMASILVLYSALIIAENFKAIVTKIGRFFAYMLRLK